MDLTMELTELNNGRLYIHMHTVGLYRSISKYISCNAIEHAGIVN